MKNILICLIVLGIAPISNAATIECTDPHSTVEVSIQLASSPSLNFEFKLPKSGLQVASYPDSDVGFYDVKGTMNCISDPADDLLIHCFSEGATPTVTDETNGMTKTFKTVVSFDLQEVTTTSVAGTSSERVGSLFLMGGGLSLSNDLRIIHFGNLAGSGIEGSCAVR